MESSRVVSRRTIVRTTIWLWVVSFWLGGKCHYVNTPKAHLILSCIGIVYAAWHGWERNQIRSHHSDSRRVRYYRVDYTCHNAWVIRNFCIVSRLLYPLATASILSTRCIRMTTLGWLWKFQVHIMACPRAYQRLKAEITDAVKSGKASSPITNAQAWELPYLQVRISSNWT